MPFKSEAQRRFMWAKHPHMAKEWESKTPKKKKLPEHVKKTAQLACLDYMKLSASLEELREEEEKEEAGTPDVPKGEVLQFFKEHPNPEDYDLHYWAEQKGYNPHKVEEVVYKMLSNKLSADKNDLIPGGKASGKPTSDFSAAQIAMGKEVEKEHTPDEAKAVEISKDHLEEFPDYYTRLKKMEDEAKKEEKKAAMLYALLSKKAQAKPCYLASSILQKLAKKRDYDVSQRIGGFQSKAQQRKMFAMEERGELPKGKAKEWAKDTPNIEKLPEKKRKKKTASMVADIVLSKLTGQ